MHTIETFSYFPAGDFTVFNISVAYSTVNVSELNGTGAEPESGAIGTDPELPEDAVFAWPFPTLGNNSYYTTSANQSYRRGLISTRTIGTNSTR